MAKSSVSAQWTPTTSARLARHVAPALRGRRLPEDPRGARGAMGAPRPRGPLSNHVKFLSNSAGASRPSVKSPSNLRQIRGRYAPAERNPCKFRGRPALCQIPSMPVKFQTPLGPLLSPSAGRRWRGRRPPTSSRLRRRGKSWHQFAKLYRTGAHACVSGAHNMKPSNVSGYM